MKHKRVPLPGEEWRPVPSLWGYEASSLGRVCYRDRLVGKKPCKIFGYHHFTLRPGACFRRPDGSWAVTMKPKKLRVHRMVLEAFHGPAPFPGAECCHGNGKRDDNRIENLRWGSRQENAADLARHGTMMGVPKPRKLTPSKVREIRRAEGTLFEIAERFDVVFETIHCVRSGKTWRHVE